DWILIETPDNSTGVITEDGDTVTYVYAPAGTVVIQHVDTDNNPLVPEEASKGRVGDDYTSAPENVPGYVLVTTPTNANGEYAEGTTTVTYVYAVAGTVIVEYVDEDGNPISEPTSSTGAEGADYTTTPKEIDGYELVKVPTNAKGQY